MARITYINDEFLFNFDDYYLYQNYQKTDITIKGRPADLLECLCSRPGHPFSYSEISDFIGNMDCVRQKGNRRKKEYDKYYDEYYIGEYEKNTIRPWFTSLRHAHDIFQNQKVLETSRGLGYTYYGSSIKNVDINNNQREVTHIQQILPHELSITPFIRTSKKKILFRNTEYDQITDHLSNYKSIVLSGMGGTGKTSIARLVYSQIKKDYDCCGWINYSQDLKHSLISSIKIDYPPEIASSSDANIKWNYLSKTLANSTQRKLFVIDNVDYIDGVQSPLDDEDLFRISDWDNTHLILTTRFANIDGFDYVMSIHNLGDEVQCDLCIELFFFYNKNAAQERSKNTPVVKELCKIAGYNTMVIELLAKDSRYDFHDLSAYLQRLSKNGFKYSDEVPIETEHDYFVTEGSTYNRGNETLVSQLMKLFNMRQRTSIEKHVLWDFHLLPEGEKITRNELKTWLGYTLTDIDKLTAEGWLKYEDGLLSMHPLINQSIRCSNQAPETYWKMNEDRTKSFKNKTLVSLIKENSLFNPSDSFSLSLRKIYFSDYLTYGGQFLSAPELLYIADYARKCGVRSLAKNYYKASYDKLRITLSNMHFFDDTIIVSSSYFSEINTVKLYWKSAYYYGYMLSYTGIGQDEAAVYLHDAATALEKIRKYLSEEEDSDLMSKTYDHIGYVIANNQNSTLVDLIKASLYYKNAIDLRKKLVTNFPGNLSYYSNLAWSLDNLGALFTFVSSKGNYEYLNIVASNNDTTFMEAYDFFNTSMQNAEQYLVESLEMRKKIAQEKQEYNSTEVAWTYVNLASYLSSFPSRYKEAEDAIQEALNIYQKINEEYPEQHESSNARAYTVYGKLLSVWNGRKNEAHQMYKKSLSINICLEHDYPGVYTREIELLEAAIEELHLRE